MKNLALAMTLIATAGSASAFWNDADSNTSGYGNGDFVGQTQGRGAANGKFSMSIKAKGSADMAGNGVFDGNNGSYAGAYGDRSYYYNNSNNANGNFYNDGRVNTATSGAGSATGDFEFTMNAEGSANGNMSADGKSNTGVYGQGYRQPYYGYAPYHSNIQ